MLKNRLFRLQRGYSDITYRLGGADFDKPFFTVLPKFKPFSDQDFLAVRAHPNIETLGNYYGIDFSTLSSNGFATGYGVGSFSSLIDFLNNMRTFYGVANPKISSVLGMPPSKREKVVMVDKSIKQLVLDHMLAVNDNYNYPTVTVDIKNLEEFAQYAKIYPTIAQKLTLLCNGQDKEQLAIPIIHYKETGNVKIIKSLLPANYRDTTQVNKDIYAMKLPKNVDIDGRTQFEVTIAGDDTAKQVLKTENPLAMARIMDFLNQTGAPMLPFLLGSPTNWIIQPFTPPPAVITEGVDLNVFFTDNAATRFDLKVQKNAEKAALKVEKPVFSGFDSFEELESEQVENTPTQPTTTKIVDFEPNRIFWGVLLLVFLIFIFAKASKE